MIFYWYHCPTCDLKFNSKASRETCPTCGGKVKLMQMIQRTMSPIKETGHKTVYSRALAIDPSQVEEAVRMHPDENYVINEKEGIAMLEIHGAKHQEKMAKRHGMVCYSQADCQKQNFGMKK
jgi:DNA-directed RNA polymerase subunit RPC12/RpoP